MKALPAVAVLGLGAMGHAFAANLLKKGFTVYGWNRTPGRGDDLVSEGLVQRETAAQAVRDAQVIIAMLTDGDATLAAIRAIAPSCRKTATRISKPNSSSLSKPNCGKTPWGRISICGPPIPNRATGRCTTQKTRRLFAKRITSRKSGPPFPCSGGRNGCSYE